MTKQEIIKTLNETDDFKALGFEALADDGSNQLLRKKYGRGFMLLNRYEDIASGAFYESNIAGWDNR